MIENRENDTVGLTVVPIYIYINTSIYSHKSAPADVAIIPVGNRRGGPRENVGGVQIKTDRGVGSGSFVNFCPPPRQTDIP